MSNRARQSAGVLFSFALLAIVETALYQRVGTSFVTQLIAGSSMPFIVFSAGCIIGMAWEYAGQFVLSWWDYPSINRHRWLFATLPLFWGIFMLIMQDGYALARIAGFGSIPAVLVSTAIIAVLIEGVNLWTKSWVYTNRGSSVALLILGWLVGLAYTFVLGFNTFFVNPFGF